MSRSASAPRRPKSGVSRLDLNTILSRNPQAAFLVRIAGSAMREAGIDDGDLALVDRALDASHRQVVIAVHQDEFLCRRLCRRGEAMGLQATDPDVPDVWQAPSFNRQQTSEYWVKRVNRL